MKDFVSVVIPCFNGENYISDAIRSVLDQTYSSLEIIVVDDASTDNSVDIIASFAKKDYRVNLIIHEKNKGGAATRNTGIMASSGQFIAFLDQDDLYEYQKIEYHVKAFRDNGKRVGAVFSDVFILKNNRKELRSLEKYDPIYCSKIKFIEQLFKGNFLNSFSQVTVRKECFETLGLLDDRLYGSDDYDFWLRLLSHYDFVRIAKPLISVRKHQNNTSYLGRYRMLQDVKLIIVPRALSRHPFLKNKEKQKLSQLEYRYGAFLWFDGYRLLALKQFIKSIIIDPVNIKRHLRNIKKILSSLLQGIEQKWHKIRVLK